MKRFMRRRPSPALVVSTVALFVALGGTGYAVTALPKNSVGSAQVINGSLLKEDLGKRTIAALQGKQGQQGPAGVTGQQGATGPQGEAAHVLWAKFAEGPPPFLIGANSAASGVERLRPGVFRLTFKQDVSSCAYEATLVSAGPVNGATFDLSKGQISAGPDFTNGANNPTAVDVQVVDSSGVLSDNVGSVALAVFC